MQRHTHGKAKRISLLVSYPQLGTPDRLQDLGLVSGKIEEKEVEGEFRACRDIV